MTAKLYNLARMSVSVGGTGTITLNAAVTGFLTFGLAGASDGDLITYAINDPGTGPTTSEIGRATYNSSATVTLSNRNVFASTSGGAAINVSVNAHVFICPARDDFAGDWCYTQANLGGL